MSLSWWLMGAAGLCATIAAEAIAREFVEYVLSPSTIAKVSVIESDERLAGPTYFRVIVQVSDIETKRLAALTRDNVEKELKIIGKGEVLFSPIIREQVPNGQLEIPRRTKEEAEELARRLRSSPES
jgi:preprotein translocase subunit SecD